MVLFPVIIVFGAISLSYLAAAPEASRPWLWALIAVGAALWCWRALAAYRMRVIERRFIEREFSIEDTRIVVRQPTKTDLDPPAISEYTLFGKLYHGLGPYLIFVIPLAYPLQRLLTDTAGSAATLLLLAILGCPVTIYLLGRLTCGAYLWVYKVWQLERQHGKPVVFETTD